MSGPPRVEFWYDFASPSSYPAAMTVARRAADRGVTVRWRPVLLAPVAGDAPAWPGVEAACRQAGVPFRRPSVFPRDPRPAVRAALACEALSLDVAAFSRAVFDANFARDQDISDVGRLGEILAEIDYPGGAVLERAAADEAGARLEAQAADAAELGVTATPSFTARGGAAFRGFDRLEEALGWAAGTVPPVSADAGGPALSDTQPTPNRTDAPLTASKPGSPPARG